MSSSTIISIQSNIKKGLEGASEIYAGIFDIKRCRQMNEVPSRVFLTAEANPSCTEANCQIHQKINN
jgi:hypothetical protein